MSEKYRRYLDHTIDCPCQRCIEWRTAELVVHLLDERDSKEIRKLEEEIEDLKHELMSRNEKFDVEIPIGPVVFIDPVNPKHQVWKNPEEYLRACLRPKCNGQYMPTEYGWKCSCCDLVLPIGTKSPNFL